VFARLVAALVFKSTRAFFRPFGTVLGNRRKCRDFKGFWRESALSILSAETLKKALYRPQRGNERGKKSLVLGPVTLTGFCSSLVLRPVTLTIFRRTPFRPG
jgi:hypothetical protein